jgi:hypothetical protein
VRTHLLSGLIIAVCVFTLSACSSTPVTMNEEVERADIDMTKGRMIRAQAAGFQLMLVIPIMVNSRQARAWEQLKQEGGNDYISGVTITERWTYGFVGTAYTTIIEAMAYPRIRKDAQRQNGPVPVVVPVPRIKQPSVQPAERKDARQKSGPCQRTDRGLICRGESDYLLH